MIMSAAAEQKTTEPSMEEILASIRRIISDDQQPAQPAAAPAPVAAAPKPTPPVQPAPAAYVAPPAPVAPQPVAPVVQAPAPTDPEPEDDVFELTMPVVSPVIEEPVKVEALHMPEPVPEPAPKPVYIQPPLSVSEQSIPNEPLITGQTDKLVSGAFGNLAHTVLSQNARTLDDVVKDMLHPMLKSWLDSNLPTIVERLVRAEIERVARGGR